MSSKCKVCAKSTTGSKSKIQCVDCQMFLHGSCVNLSKNDIAFYEQEGEVYRCDDCNKARRKSMQVESELGKSTPNIEDVLELLGVMREENQQQSKKLESEMGKSLEFNQGQIEELSAVVKRQTESLRKFEEMYSLIVDENAKLKKNINVLEQRLDEMEQYSRVNCIEINGIPEEKTESVLEIVKKVGSSLDMTITDDMVDSCHRLGQTFQGRTRGIIVKFVRRSVKEELLQKRRVKRNLNTHHIGFGDRSADVVYINESLTPLRRKIHTAARALKKEKGYQFLWIRNGRILLRTNEGAKVISLTSIEQVEELRSRPTPGEDAISTPK